ncbi:MAG: DNA gyrase subunit A [Paludibacteraceae bacterium]|nr:DNA gyrase subunit A [Paludibacteraceae bacterium]
MSEDRIIKVDINEEMRNSYRDYAMSVIVARALPDARDGLKPVHRRVLYGMHELGLTAEKPTKKCARIVGEVLGKYHPHGDSSVYGTLVRLAQGWNMRYTLADGQGNFGSVDGDSPAAMRYTEARLQKISAELLRDIEKETVDFQDNFDGEYQEPTVLPTRVPNLIVNGAAGIAVGMATNMPPHNLSDTLDTVIAYVRNPEIDDEEMIKIIKAPDFPTGGIICGYQGVKDAYLKGQGRIVIKSKAEIENDGNRDKIVVTEIPYQVNKKDLIEQIADLAKEGKIEGISNVNDESDFEGMRIVIDLKTNVNSNVVLNKLFKMTPLQSSFSVNSIALVNGRPQTLTLRDQIRVFADFRMDVIIRRTKFELREAEKRAHLLKGRIIAVDNIDLVIRLIRESATTAEAIQKLQDNLPLDEIQAKDIVEMRLRALTGLEIDKLKAEFEEVMALINYLNEILTNEELRKKIIIEELTEVKEKYGDERRTEIDYVGENFNPEDFYSDDDMIITISHLGYVKSTPLAEYKTQGRGGVGSKASNSRDEDFIEYIYQASMHDTLLLFSQKGRCYWLRVYEIQPGQKTSKGRALQNLINLEPDDRINAFVKVRGLNDKEYVNSHYLIFCTKNGVVKRTSLEQYSRPRTKGVIAISIREDDEVINVALTDGHTDVIIASRNGRAVRFKEDSGDLRPLSRAATGVKGMTLDPNDPTDKVVGMVCIEKGSNESLMVVSEKGYGKRSYLDDRDENGNIVLDEDGNPASLYRITKRGAKGVRTINITEKTGKLIAIAAVTDENDLMIINTSGIAIRMKIDGLRVLGRASQGVRLINLSKKNDMIASVCKVTAEEDEEAQQADGEVMADDVVINDDPADLDADTSAEDAAAENDQTPTDEE